MADSIQDSMIDERFWLGLSKSMVTSAITRREEAASRLVTGVGWFWTVYSAVVVTALAVSGKQEIVVAVALILPVAALVVAYLAGLMTLQPIDQSFLVNSPTQIQRLYDEAVARKRKLLRRARIWTVISGAMVIIAIMTAALSKGPQS
ncbi:hypothetical protein ABZ092_32775 [Streptomyces bobili]|uniref:hypothetical protein n=1 Tax=Streptomyces bobili TaxID=67280 RepID=UPI0033B35090